MADRLVAHRPEGPSPAVARIEPTVTQPCFETIEQHVGTVYRYALRLARRSDLAEDLTQETMLRGWRRRDSLRDARLARVWLLRIATNIWNDQLRRAKFKMATLEREPPCPRRSPSMLSGERENVRLALEAMDELPPRQRQVIYLTSCEGLSISEVAKVLQTNASTVKSNLSLARKEMRRQLKDLYDEVRGRACEKNE
jgi:RNA polymerase sigma-70 factor (ECF subfamily)